MRIRLLEDFPVFDEETIKNYSRMNDSEKVQIVDDYIEKSGNNNIRPLKNTIRYTFDRWGIDPDKNDFYNYWWKLSFTPKGKELQNFDDFTQMVSDKEIKNIYKDWFNDETLFDRTPQEFEYTVKAFEIASNPQELRKFFKDTTNIGIEDFYSDDGKIKSAGNSRTADDVNTIYGTIESWSSSSDENSLDNDLKHDEIGSYSLRDVLNRFSISDKDAVKVVSKWISDYGTSSKTTNFYIPDKENDTAYYVDKFVKIMSLEQLKPLTKEQENKIKQKYTFDHIRAIPKDYWVDGNIIYLKKLYHLSRPSDLMEFDDFAIFKDGEWQKYNDYIKQQPNKNLLSEAKKKLLTERDIEDDSSKYSVVAGVMYILDQIKI